MNSGFHEHVAVFVAIAKSRNLTKAALATGVGQSTLSRQLATLEKHLGCKLFHRSTRSITLTDRGALFLPQAENLLQLAAAASEALRDKSVGFSGRIRVACSIAVGRRLLIPALPRWQSLHPSVQLDLVLSDRVVNVVEDGVDVAIRAGPLSHSRLIAKPLTVSKRVAVASAGYLRHTSAPQHPRELKQHRCIVYSGLDRPDEWEFEHTRGKVSVRVPTLLSLSTVDALYDAVRAGLGIAVMPAWLCRNALADGSFVRVLSDYELPTLSFHIVTASRPSAKGAVGALITFIENLFHNSASS